MIKYYILLTIAIIISIIISYLKLRRKYYILRENEMDSNNAFIMDLMANKVLGGTILGVLIVVALGFVTHSVIISLIKLHIGGYGS